jgi:cell division cycle 2-like protein
MFQVLGTVKPAIWPDVVKLPNFQKVNFKDYPYNRLKQHFPMLTDAGFDLLNRMLTYDPARRITAREALEHPWFNESPLPVDPDMMPTWPSRSEGRPRAPEKRD